MSKKMSSDTNAINWFEIAVSDIKRATKFYETILEIKTTPMEMMGMKMAMFPYDGSKGTVGGALAQSEMHKPTVPFEMMGMKMAMFPYDGSKGTVGGALAQSEMHKPSATGSVIYLNANPDLDLVVKRIEKTGGKIIMPKTLIDENTGYMAFFTDTEGNT